MSKLANTKLDWDVRTESISTESGIIIPNSVALVRDDTNVPLSVVSTSYHPYQNSQLMELLERVSDKTGVKIHKTGYFGDGQKVYIQLKTNDLDMPKNDKVLGFITGINSFDGSTSLAFGNSTITISCENTFFAALRELKAKIRHTKNMLIKVDEVAASIDKAIDEEQKMFRRIKRLGEVRMSDKVKDLVIKALFDLDSTLDLRQEDSVSTVTRNKITRFDMDLQTEVADKGDNLWGLFSGVTRYTTHSLVKGDSNEAKLFGVYGNRERIVFDTLAELGNVLN
jgi:phage/plasmid-like protein (TIGR03299 family)